ncbi:MAG: hypothetical protein E6G56_13575 [Actinobacteria bacterium]|nr:MAG: hypothetical protein E6G56_13575 [Actinomycetota bacterium]
MHHSYGSQARKETVEDYTDRLAALLIHVPLDGLDVDELIAGHAHERDTILGADRQCRLEERATGG